MRPAAQKSSEREACLRHGEHAVQRDQRVARDLGVDGDLVDDLAPRQVLQRPEDVGGMDAVHRRAGADDRIEAEDVLVRQLRVEAVDQVDLGADGPGRPGGRRRDGVDDELGRAVTIGGLDDLQPALRVDDDVDPGCSARAAAICSTEKRAWTEQ